MQMKMRHSVAVSAGVIHIIASAIFRLFIEKIIWFK